MVRPYCWMLQKAAGQVNLDESHAKTWDAIPTKAQTEQNVLTFLPLTHNINLIFSSNSLMCMCPGIFSYKRNKKKKKKKRLNI